MTGERSLLRSGNLRGQSGPQAAENLQRVPFHVRVVGLPCLAPSQAPQSARREDEGEAPEPAERPECPDEEEAAGGLGDLAVMCPPHVHDVHGCREHPKTQTMLPQLAMPMEKHRAIRSLRTTRAVATGAPWSCMRGGYHFLF